MAADPRASDDPHERAWRGFNSGPWKSRVNLRDFIQRNYTPYAVRCWSAGSRPYLERGLREGKLTETQAQDRRVPARPAVLQGVCGTGCDDGCDRRSARRTTCAVVEIPFRALRLRVRGLSMRRLFADRLVVATAVIVILMSVGFAFSRVAG